MYTCRSEVENWNRYYLKSTCRLSQIHNSKVIIVNKVRTS